MFAPSIHAGDDRPGAHPAREAIVAGWELFAEQAPRDVVAAILAVHAHPAVLSDQLAAYPATLLHGDAKLPNLGLGPTGLIAVDWGDLTGFGPPEVDVAWYALMNELRLGVTPDTTFAAYQALATQPLEPQAVDLACIGSLAQMGFRLAGTAVGGDSPAERARADARLAWWCHRVRVALDRTGIV
jgi:aminoglycoside phosphotransferase (APT) family kinase protein